MLVEILKKLLCPDFEDEFWSRFVFELVVWPNRLLWKDELNPRVRCAFGNVNITASLIGSKVATFSYLQQRVPDHVNLWTCDTEVKRRWRWRCLDVTKAGCQGLLTQHVLVRVVPQVRQGQWGDGSRSDLVSYSVTCLLLNGTANPILGLQSLGHVVVPILRKCTHLEKQSVWFLSLQYQLPCRNTELT